MSNLGIELPPGHRLVSLAEDPSLRRKMGGLNVSVWPMFMVEGGDEAAANNWDRLFEQWPEYQHGLFDANGRLVAANNSAPLAWDGTHDDFPDGWDDQLVRSAADEDGGRAVDTLGAVQIIVDPAVEGSPCRSTASATRGSTTTRTWRWYTRSRCPSSMRRGTFRGT